MGQQVAVVEKPSPRPGLLRFETNRSLTGMGHEHFNSLQRWQQLDDRFVHRQGALTCHDVRERRETFSQ